MNKNHQEYELNILKKVINEHLDQIIPVTDEGLNHLLSHHDDTVWNIATKIYSQSGYKVEFSFIRDLLNVRIGVVKQRIADEKAQRAKQARFEAERQAEQARLQSDWVSPMLTYTEVFEKVKKIIIDELSVESDRVTLSSHISNDLGANEVETRQLAMALEDEFEIEIPDDNSLLGSEKNFRIERGDDGASHGVSWCLSGDGYRPVACTVEKLVEYIHQRISEQNLS
ncbi:acyl carrier protein [Nodularia sphaerocarpa]|uniref:acyl carrier protein n=1 Tax=Nodularia sphaerocarpa TaxID=137816 RepID=UPI001EFB9AB3|nr:acyl carrier protein [Nodularia sphaerocarpa]MDB9374908.1 acyl carrier protein [Nodularia sphaerocarpa CS-585]MDB9380168.1 acyl carrier protein [Nodularia sphaerocarpa CS-585A2]ULP72741.1 Acyl carrier protein [Nodularia sphaerocarpa UHCC 0038]